VGASLLAKASYQTPFSFLTQRIREQARSHRGEMRDQQQDYYKPGNALLIDPGLSRTRRKA